jgi:hypothetical protein
MKTPYDNNDRYAFRSMLTEFIDRKIKLYVNE